MDRAVHQLVRADHWAQTERKPIPDQKGQQRYQPRPGRTDYSQISKRQQGLAAHRRR